MTATIDLKIERACQETQILSKKNSRWQEDMDNVLDRMNDLNRFLTELQRLLLHLTFEIERDMNGFRQSEIAPKALKKLVVTSIKMLNKVKKSELYPGVKTTYHTLRQEVSYINELLQDRVISLALQNDDEMAQIIKDTLDSSHKK